MMLDPAWHTHPQAPKGLAFDKHWRIYGQLLQPGDVIAEGDLFVAAVGWLPSALIGEPLSLSCKTTYVRPLTCAPV